MNAWFAGVCELVGTRNFKKRHVMEVFCFVHTFLCLFGWVPLGVVVYPVPSVVFI